MWPFTRVPKPKPKRLAELEADVADVALAVAWCKKGIVDLNARRATLVRQRMPAERREEEAPGAEEPQYQDDLTAPSRFPVPRPAASTAHLARRFRGT